MDESIKKYGIVNPTNKLYALKFQGNVKKSNKHNRL